MNNRVLSIEIGNSFTKICEMDYKVKKPKVYKVLTVETPEGIVVDGMLQPTQEYADHLVNALGTNGIRTKKVLFTISSTSWHRCAAGRSSVSTTAATAYTRFSAMRSPKKLLWSSKSMRTAPL